MKTQTIKTAYTYTEWCKLVDRHAKKMAVKWLVRKIRGLLLITTGTIALVAVTGLISTFVEIICRL